MTASESLVLAGFALGVLFTLLVLGERWRQARERKYFAAAEQNKLSRRRDLVLQIGLSNVEVVEQCRAEISDLKIRLHQLDLLLNDGYWSEEYHFNTKESALGLVGAAHDRCWKMTEALNELLVRHDFLARAWYYPPGYHDLKALKLVNTSDEVSH